ncbi:AraC family transcriptional regulator [Candidatus Entotheonella palauensis]|uniref:AraC family transcriptional regulator n=1 Tax=Candidatus Entotheonella palauensis TaxID=93172 RepID=UPI000B7CC53E|nr:AraC family transcriptional regulator [Candidatus Entotheonella palauensis]
MNKDNPNEAILRDATVSVRAVRPMVAYLHALGANVDTLLTEAGIRGDMLADPDARAFHHAVTSLWQRASEACGDPDAFGLHVAEHADLSQFDIIHFVYANSSTVGEGIDRLVRYYRLIHDVSRLEMVDRGPHTMMRHVLPGATVAPRHVAEWVLAVVLRLARHATGRPGLAPLAVHFCHPAPKDISEHERLFRAPLHFGMADNGLLVDPAFLKMPHRTSNPALLNVLVRHAADLLARVPSADSFCDRVRTLIVDELDGGNLSAEYLAERCHMSVRTFSRRLREEGTSYKTLLDEVRSQLAERYLDDDNLAVADVAFLLGFAESSTFHRAFKRWFRVSPSQLRQGMRGGETQRA